MRPLLTIAIPTFDRAHALERLLESLSTQAGIGEVQILVSDNGSGDGTQAVLAGFSDRLRLKRSGFDRNRGFDANYLNCIRVADGDYVWVVGDDDNLVPGAVEAVLSTLRSASPDLVVCNGGDFRSGVLVPRIRYQVGDLSTIDSLMRQVGWHLCWIGTCIVRRSRYRTEQLQPHDFNAFVHLPLLVGALSAPYTAQFIERVLLHTTVNHSAYFKDPRVLVETFGRQLHDTLACLGTGAAVEKTAARVVRGFHDQLSMFGLRDFLTFRRDPRFKLTEFARRLRYIRRLNPWAPLFGLLYLIPLAVLNRSLSVYRQWRAGRRPVGNTA